MHYNMSPSPPAVPGVSQQGQTMGGEGRYDEEEEEEDISPDLWQEACWIVIRLDFLNNTHYTKTANCGVHMGRYIIHTQLIL